jgi:putative peptidoglycan lipid II flippase
LAVVGIFFAGAIVDALAPGFAGERRALAVGYLRIAAPYVALAGAVAVVASLLNAQGRVLAAALGVVAFNMVLVLSLAWVAAGEPPPAAIGTGLAYAIVLGGMAQLVVTGFGLLRQREDPPWPRLRFSNDVRRFFALAVPGLIAAGIPQLKLIAGAMISSSSPAAVSWLYYANRLYELPLGVVSIAIAAVLGPAIAVAARGAKEREVAAAQTRALEFVIGLALPAAAAFALLAEPIARALFERGAFQLSDSVAVATALAAICSGLPGHALEKLFGAVSFAREDTRTPMLAALLGLATAIAGSLALFPHYGHAGVAAAIAVSGWVGATLLGIILRRRGWLHLDGAAIRRLPVIFSLSVLLVRCPTFAGSPLGRVGALVALVATGLATYLTALQALGVARTRDLVDAFRRRL